MQRINHQKKRRTQAIPRVNRAGQNRGEDDVKVKLYMAIKEWDTGRNRGRISLSLKHFSWIVGIPYETFKNYVAKDSIKQMFVATMLGENLW